MILPILFLLQGATADLRPQLDSIIPALMREHAVPGAAVAILREGRIAVAGFGSARLDPAVPVDPATTRFRVGSIGKLFVAASVARKVRLGRLSLDEDVRSRVPEVPLGPADAAPVTLRQLLTHTAGFDERLVGYAARAPTEMRPLGEYLEARMPPRGWPAGRLVGYSNHGVALAAYVVERRDGLPFRDVAARDLFGPLGMRRTFYLAPDSSVDASDRALGYRCGNAGCSPTVAAISHAYPVGLVYSTAEDMGRFVRGLLTELPAEERALLFERHFTPEARLPGLGLAFFEQRWAGETVFAHSGVVPGSTSLLAVVPARGVGFAVLSNASNTRFTSAVHDRLMELLVGSPVPQAFATLPGDVAPFAGTYRMTRYAHATLERFPLMFATGARVTSSGDTLFVPFGARRLAMQRVDSLLFREIGGDRLTAFAVDARGRVTHLYAPANVAGAELPAAFERAAWHEVPYFLNEYVSWLLMGPVLVLFAWSAVRGVIAVVHRRRGNTPRVSRALPRGSWMLVAAGPVAFAVLGFGLIARSTRDLERSEGIVFGLGGIHVAFLAIPWLLVALAVFNAVLLVDVWRRERTLAVDRAAVSLLGLGLLLQLHFLVSWNYLPARW